MENLLILMEGEYFGNTILHYAYFLVIFVLLFLLFFVFKRVIIGKARKFIEQSEVGELVIAVIDRIKPSFYALVSLYVAMGVLVVPFYLRRFLIGLIVIWSAYICVIAAQMLIDFSVGKYLKSKEERESSMIKLIAKIAKILLWAFAILVVLSTMGVNVTALIAGMGIGGVAVAFALQNILGDLFSSFAIYFDKPFVEGDFIIVGEKMGVVEKIGIKTTRLRALQGEEIVMSNAELTSVQIHNFKKMQKRRIDFGFGVTYNTPSEKLERIPAMVEEIVKEEELADFERIHFNQFAESSLLFAGVYYINSADFADYMKTHQSILFKIKRKFEEEGISMAFPTTTVYLEKSPNEK